jgi:nitrous oxide reductase accessory protein NosL
MRLRLLATILVVVFVAGCGGGEEEELTAPTEETEIVEDTTEVTQVPPRDEG